MIKGIGHVALVVSDLDASMHFYHEILGFEDLFDWRNSQGEPWIRYLKIKDMQFLELFYDKAHTPVEISDAHLCLEVDDIEEVASRLIASGVQLDNPPRQGGDLNYQCWARDPDGNRIEFMQMHKDSPQVRAR
jgi:lactoylglutathione lyase